MIERTKRSNPPNSIHWSVTLFFALSILVAAIGTPFYLIQYGFEWSIWVTALIYGALTTLGITAGYHRLLAHRSYQANPWVKAFFLFVGSAAWQASAMKWATDHRRHHRNVDSPADPYNIQEGFWHAHMGWLFTKDAPEFRDKFDGDLKRDPWIIWQHKFYVPLAIFSGFIVPTLLGALLGNALGGLLIVGFLRMVAVHQLTFFINSLCHMIGSQPYSDKFSARDNAILALFTFGEGYHNFHHRFASDYRNGVRWYHWDPAKWLIGVLSCFGWTHSLKRISPSEILMVKVGQEEKQRLQQGANPDRIGMLKQSLTEAQQRFRELKDTYQLEKKNAQERSDRGLRDLKREMKRARREFKSAVRNWKYYGQTFDSLSGNA